MLIDWFTVGAQALNFVILVWLLKRFLYKPVLNAIDAREQRIAKELADADAKKVEAKKESDEFQHKNAEFDQQRAEVLKTATDAANAEGKRLLDNARKAADELSAKRAEALRNDAHNLNQAISRRAQQEVFSIARKVLGDLAGITLEQRISEVFVQRIRTLTGEAKQHLGDALKHTNKPVLVSSAFDLPQAQQAAIHQAINETFSADIPLRFETASDIVRGIEIYAEGQKVSWSIAEYLQSLQQGVDELVKQQSDAKAAPRKP